MVEADPQASAARRVSASTAAPPTPPAPPDRCIDYRTRRDARLHHALATLGDAGSRYAPGAWTQTDLKRAIDDAALTCLPFARGRWSVDPGGRWRSRSSATTTATAYRSSG